VVAGGGGGTLVAKALGWSSLFAIMAGLLLLIMLLPLWIRERAPRDDDQPLTPGLLKLSIFLLPFVAVGLAMFGMGQLESQLGDNPLALLIPVAQPFVAVLGALLAWPWVDPKGFGALRASFATPTPWWAVLAGIATPAGYAMVGPAMTKLVRGELALSEERIALLSGVIDPTAGVIGALIGGVLADRLGVRRAMGLCMGGIGGLLLVWSLSHEHWSIFAWLALWTAVSQGLINAYNAGSLGMYMSVSNPKVGATHFAIYMAATNLTYAWTAPLGGLVADRYGFPVLFAVAAAVQVLTIVLLVPINARQAQEHFARG
jgi:predicted MFS family arabinose efflux permease